MNDPSDIYIHVKYGDIEGGFELRGYYPVCKLKSLALFLAKCVWQLRNKCQLREKKAIEMSEHRKAILGILRERLEFLKKYSSAVKPRRIVIKPQKPEQKSLSEKEKQWRELRETISVPRESE